METVSNKEEQERGFSPWLWTSLALFCGLLLAVSSEIRMITSHYHFEARYLQAPGTFFTNLIVLFVIATKSQNKDNQKEKLFDDRTSKFSDEVMLIKAEKDSMNETFNWDWLRDIFWEIAGSESKSESQSYVLNKKRS